MQKRIAVLASGRGSNFQAIIEAIQDGKIPATCSALITDNPDAYAIERARKAKIPVIVVDYAMFSSRELYEHALLSAMLQVRVDLFVLAGYMRIIGLCHRLLFSGKNDEHSSGAPAQFHRVACPATGCALRCEGIGLYSTFR